MKFKYLKPKETDWIESNCSSPIEAIQNHHYDNYECGYDVIIMVDCDSSGKKEKQGFALVKTEDGQEYISRICSSGLWRKGGVKPPHVKGLEYVAEILGVEIDRLKGPWESEEQYE